MICNQPSTIPDNHVIISPISNIQRLLAMAKKDVNLSELGTPERCVADFCLIPVEL